MSGVKEALKKIEEQAAGRTIDDVDELVLDQIQIEKFSPELAKALEKYENLFFLSLNDCGITSLDGLPNLTKLIRVTNIPDLMVNNHASQFELTDNKLSGPTLNNLTKLSSLQSLSLGGNPISNLDDLRPLTKLEKVVQIDLFGSPISEQDDYRDKVFQMFANLQILDNKDEQGEEIDYDGEEGEEDGEELDEDEFDEEEEGGDEDEDEDGEDEPKVNQKKVKK